MAGGRVRIVLAQILVGSTMAWLFAGGLIGCIHFFGDRPWGDAARLGCMFTTLLVVGYGAVGLGGGLVAIPSRVFRMLAVEHRDRVTDDPGGLTPLGLALVVAPQLVAVAMVLS